MCHHWDYERAYEREDEAETGDEPAAESIERIVEVDPEPEAEDETAEREDDPLADVPLADD